MVAIVTRAGKGSPLTNAEVDSNFENLNNGKVENTQAGILAALGFTPANKAGDTFSGDVVFNGKIASGTSVTASTNYRFGRGITGGTSASAFVQNGNVQSDVTTTAVSFNSQANTAAASFTLTTYQHFIAQQGVIGAGSSITNVVGFNADSTLAGSTATYGYRGQVTTGSGKWNLFMDGSAGNFLAGGLVINNNLGLGSSGSPSYGTANQILTSQGSGAVPSWQSVKTVNGNSILGSGNIQIDGGVTSFNTRTGAVTLSSGDVTTALGFTPYNATNPSGYITNTGNARVGVENNGTLVGTRRNINFIPGTGISLSISDDSANEEVDVTITSTVTAPVQSVFGRTGNVTLASSDVTTALGYTPYNSSNPNGYITSSSLSSYLPLSGGTLSGKLTSAAIAGSQSGNTSTLEVRNNGSTGDSNLANITFHCQGTYGTSLHLRSDGIFGVGGWSASTWRWYVNLGNGDMVAAGNVTAYSDERLKKDWGVLPDDFVERLAAIKHGTYTRIDSGARQVGVSAQSLRGLMPEAVGVGEDGDTLQVSYGNAALASAVKLAERVVELTTRLQAIEQKMGA